MKLFRFIKNVWAEITKDVSSKDIFRMAIIFAISCLCLLVIYTIGKVSLFFGAGKLLPMDTADDPIAVGSLCIVVLFLLSFLSYGGYLGVTNLKKIWKNS